MSDIIQVPFVVDQDFIDSVMDGAMYGCAYWCGECDVILQPETPTEFVSHVISRGGIIRFYDAEEDEYYDLDKAKFLDGLQKWVKYRVEHGIGVSMDAGEIDAGDSDSIVQFALFGEEVYG